jgi:hypothetical protein
MDISSITYLPFIIFFSVLGYLEAKDYINGFNDRRYPVLDKLFCIAVAIFSLYGFIVISCMQIVLIKKED